MFNKTIRKQMEKCVFVVCEERKSSGISKKNSDPLVISLRNCNPMMYLLYTQTKRSLFPSAVL